MKPYLTRCEQTNKKFTYEYRGDVVSISFVMFVTLFTVSPFTDGFSVGSLMSFLPMGCVVSPIFYWFAFQLYEHVKLETNAETRMIEFHRRYPAFEGRRFWTEKTVKSARFEDCHRVRLERSRGHDSSNPYSYRIVLECFNLEMELTQAFTASETTLERAKQLVAWLKAHGAPTELIINAVI